MAISENADQHRSSVMTSEQKKQCKKIIEEKSGVLKFIHVMGTLSMDSSVVQANMTAMTIELGEVFGKKLNDDDARLILDKVKDKRTFSMFQFLGGMMVSNSMIAQQMQSAGWKIASLFDKGKM